MINYNNKNQFCFFLISYLFLIFLWAVFSFVFTDPNLTLINNQIAVNWQNFLWQHFLFNHYLRVGLYLVIVIALFINYLYLIKFWPRNNHYLKKITLAFAFLLIILIFSYNALSHDVFNYIFNARMLIVYKANPHQTAAVNFSFDPWIRFMHNIHTPAPYGQAWTLISALPYFFGFGKFLLTWLNFKAFALLGMLITYFSLKKLLNKNDRSNLYLALLFLNPLILLETISNAHNDWWMMWPVLVSFILINKFKTNKKRAFLYLILIFFLMLFSIFTKFASILAIPFILFYFIQEHLIKLSFLKNRYLLKAKIFFENYFWDLISITFFLPLFTSRSQRFLTWYLIWPMTFLPLLKSKWWQNNLIIFSFNALISYAIEIMYLPWLFFDQTVPNILLYKQVILWLPILIYNLFYLLRLIKENVDQ